MIKRIRKTNESKREKLEIFTVELDLIDRDGDYFGSEGGQTFLDEEKAIEFAIENCPGCTSDAIGVAEVWVGEWVYADSIEINPDDGEPYAWHDVYGELQDTIYTVTTATPESARKCNLFNADEYGDQSIKESRVIGTSVRRRCNLRRVIENSRLRRR